MDTVLLRLHLAAGLALVCAACRAAEASAPTTSSSTWLPPGTVLTETWKNVGHGYREVARSQVNPAGAFEGIGHFSFVYYGDEKLCQCSASEISVSPDGAFAVFTDVHDGKLMLFASGSHTRTVLSETFVGYPESTTWSLAERRAEIKLKYGNRRSLVISF